MVQNRLWLRSPSDVFGLRTAEEPTGYPPSPDPTNTFLQALEVHPWRRDKAEKLTVSRCGGSLSLHITRPPRLWLEMRERCVSSRHQNPEHNPIYLTLFSPAHRPPPHIDVGSTHRLHYSVGPFCPACMGCAHGSNSATNALLYNIIICQFCGMIFEPGVSRQALSSTLLDG